MTFTTLTRGMRLSNCGSYMIAPQIEVRTREYVAWHRCKPQARQLGIYLTLEAAQRACIDHAACQTTEAAA